MRKYHALLLTLLLALMACTALADANLLQNPGFEALGQDGLPLGWSTGAYVNTEGFTSFESAEDGQEGRCAVVRNFGANDARFAQTVTVKPNTTYRLSGYVRANEVEDYGWGANLSIDGVYMNVDSYYDTEGEWLYTELYGVTGPDQHEVTVYARLGGYGGESEGTAAFDDLSLEAWGEVPQGAICEPWYYNPSSWEDEEQEDFDDDDAAAPFWPWLLVLSALWLILGSWVTLRLIPGRHDLSRKKGLPLFVILGLALSFILRFIISVLVDGYQIDTGCFTSWGYTMADAGPVGFYNATSFCDYPPAYMLVLGLNELIARSLTSLFGGVLPNLLRRTVIIKLLPMLCDLGLALLAYRAAEKKASREQAGMLCLLMAFCPAMICNSAAWCQIDSVLCLLLALVVWFAMEHKWHIALPVYMLAVLTKPQALMAGPLGLIALALEFMPCLRRSRDEKKPSAFFALPACFRQILIGLAGAVAVALVILLPFLIGMGGIGWLIQKYSDTLASYPYATVNTTNLYYLFNANWAPIDNRAHIGANLIMTILSGAWAMWYGLQLKKRQEPLWWIEPLLSGCFALFYLVMCFVGCSWGTIGFTAMGLAFAIAVPLLVRSGRLELLPLAGGLLFLLLYVAGAKMHERYLFPALILLAMAFAIHRDWRVLAVLLLTSATLFVNEGVILDNSIRLGSASGHLNNDTYVLNMVLSVLNVLSLPLLMWSAADICLKGDVPLSGSSMIDKLIPEEKAIQGSPRDVLRFTTDSKLHWVKLDSLLLVTVTLLYSVMALWNLGSTKAPQTFWNSTSVNEQVVLDLGSHRDNVAVAYYCGVSYNNFSIAVSDDMEHWSKEYWAEMSEGSCYQWKYLMPSHESSDGVSFSWSGHLSGIQRISGRYVRVSAQQIGLKLGEILFRDANGNSIPARVVSRSGERADSPMLTDPSFCVDEPDSLEGEPSWTNSTYFDEIYHARTGKELLDGVSPYEWTHPPLGKVFMSWFIAIFGMTPFGWRFAGTLMGILMLPAMYLLGKQLTKKTWMAFLASCLMALDCMHLTQTRIATIDSFPVLFIILSYFFMLRFMQSDVTRDPLKKLLPKLGLSGLMISLAIASKWIGLYAAVGLAVLYFWTLGRHILLASRAKECLNKNTELSPEDKALLESRVDGLWRRLLILCLWCCLFFIFMPVAVYLLSYIPHMAAKRPSGLLDFIGLVIREQQNMYNYHSTPGLGMDHAFYSPWYEWPFIVRPMYYAMAQYMPSGYSLSIFSFGNPMVWLMGLVGLAVTVCLWLRPHFYRLGGRDGLLHAEATSWDTAPAFLLIGLLAQLLPWVLVPRGTYIYHYFASVPFLILAVMLMMHHLCLRFPKAGRITVIAYLVLTLLSFLVFYPYASGITAPTWWLDLGKKYLNLYYSL